MNSALPLLGLLLPMLVQAAQPNEALLQQAVSEGRVRPFHELMEVASRLPVRVLRVVTHRSSPQAGTSEAERGSDRSMAFSRCRRSLDTW